MTTKDIVLRQANPRLVPLLDLWEWQQRGNCVNEDTELFFLEDNARMGTKQRAEQAAKSVCLGCPVVNECLSHALNVPEVHGVWGGKSAEERLALSKKLSNRQLRIEGN
jgi:WhiB family transcriptional regulator, redox-sensing transcriptional regulator